MEYHLMSGEEQSGVMVGGDMPLSLCSSLKGKFKRADFQGAFGDNGLMNKNKFPEWGFAEKAGGSKLFHVFINKDGATRICATQDMDEGKFNAFKAWLVEQLKEQKDKSRQRVEFCAEMELANDDAERVAKTAEAIVPKKCSADAMEAMIKSVSARMPPGAAIKKLVADAGGGAEAEEEVAYAIAVAISRGVVDDCVATYGEKLKIPTVDTAGLFCDRGALTWSSYMEQNVAETNWEAVAGAMASEAAPLIACTAAQLVTEDIIATLATYLYDIFWGILEERVPPGEDGCEVSERVLRRVADCLGENAPECMDDQFVSRMLELVSSGVESCIKDGIMDLAGNSPDYCVGPPQKLLGGGGKRKCHPEAARDEAAAPEEGATKRRKVEEGAAALPALGSKARSFTFVSFGNVLYNAEGNAEGLRLSYMKPAPILEVDGAAVVQTDDSVFQCGGDSGENWFTDKFGWRSVNPTKRVTVFTLGGGGGQLGLGQLGRGSWEEVAPMSFARVHAAAASLEGCVYVGGGWNRRDAWNGSKLFSSMESYDPSSGAWTVRAPMLLARRDHRLVALGGHLYAIGGMVMLPVEESAVSDANAVSDASSSSVGVAEYLAVYTAQKAAGLKKTAATALVERYDPLTNTWTSVAGMGSARAAFGAAVLGGCIYVTGGCTNKEAGGAGEEGRLTSAERYDPVTNTWTAVASLPQPRSGHAMAVLRGGGAELHVLGGGAPLRYVPPAGDDADRWVEVPVA